jgi:trichohyalin
LSSEIPQISTPDAILRIKKLIDTNQGDPGRLQFISESLQKGKSLFHSDQIYLYKKISADVIPAQIKKSTEIDKKLRNVKRLISLNFGEPGRLRYILQSLQNNKKLYHSDEDYLELKTEQFHKFSEGKRLKQRIRTRIPFSAKSDSFEEEFTHPVSEETVEQHIAPYSQDIPEKLQEIEDAVLSPGPKETSDLFDLLDDSPKIDLEIDKERAKISKIKLDHEQLKVQRDELSQLIAYRQEYEIKINREKEILENEIRIEQEKVKEKDKLVEELIKNQSKLIQTKTEREVLVEQIKIDKAKSEVELKKLQDELEEIKKEYDGLQKEIKSRKQNLDNQINEQNEKIDKLKEDSEEN